MKFRRYLAVALCLTALTTVVADAQAGRPSRERGKRLNAGQRTEKTADQARPRRFGRVPEMSFVRGTLNQSGLSTWRVDSTTMRLRKDCVMTKAGEELLVLEEGREVLVMGAWRGDVLEAWGIEELTSIDGPATPNPLREIEVSDSDPAVGRILSTPY
jgi:hypothetical protein